MNQRDDFIEEIMGLAIALDLSLAGTDVRVVVAALTVLVRQGIDQAPDMKEKVFEALTCDIPEDKVGWA